MDASVDWTAIASIATVLALAGGFFKFLFDWRRDKKSLYEAKKQDSKFLIADNAWVEKKNWNYNELLKRLISLDVISLDGTDFAHIAEGTPQQWAPIFKFSDDTWYLVIYDEKTIAGYWQAISVKGNLVKKLEDGSLLDSEILISDVKKLDSTSSHDLYFVMFAIHKDFESHRVTIMSRLMESLCIFRDRIAADGIKVNNVYATGFSPQGAELCRKLGLKKTIRSAQGGWIYKSSYENIDWQKIEKYR